MQSPLVDGVRRFRRGAYPRLRERYRRLAEEGQRPPTLFIGCSDSRVDPERITDAGPGELFVVRNPGAFVPPFDPEGGGHGTAAAIEFAVVLLGVSHVVVCGHTGCGAVGALFEPPDPGGAPSLRRWLELGREVRRRAEAEADGRDVLHRAEELSVILQLERLRRYPPVAERVARGDLRLHGWQFVIREGRVRVLDEERRFVPVGDPPGED